ncbi:MAG: hypothetical protein AAGE61_18380 [Pseudomonadota bacterium]
MKAEHFAKNFLADNYTTMVFSKIVIGFAFIYILFGVISGLYNPPLHIYSASAAGIFAILMMNRRGKKMKDIQSIDKYNYSEKVD